MYRQNIVKSTQPLNQQPQSNQPTPHSTFQHCKAYKVLSRTHRHTFPRRSRLWSGCSILSWLVPRLWHKPWCTCTSRSGLRKGNNKLLSAVVARANCLRMHTMPALHSLHTPSSWWRTKWREHRSTSTGRREKWFVSVFSVMGIGYISNYW